jgi:hypothetical protein
MYDKYLTGNTFVPGPTRLPKHKGVIINSSDGTAKASGFTAYILNDQGNTFAMSFPLAAGPNYYSNQFYSINQLLSGATGIIMN